MLVELCYWMEEVLKASLELEAVNRNRGAANTAAREKPVYWNYELRHVSTAAGLKPAGFWLSDS